MMAMWQKIVNFAQYFVITIVIIVKVNFLDIV